MRVTRADGNRIVRIGPMRPGDRIELRYRHSVERTPIVEVFRVERDGLWFEEMRFVSQGAGLPTEGYVKEGDHFVLRQPRRVGTLPVLLSELAGHRLYAAGRETDLVRGFSDGDSVSVSVVPFAGRRRPGPR
ncbi:MAG: hypothetical protein A2Z07_13270 [Armatimonadetes bacterium RBG_16_67_12]|nr:MAG: hypothetical protein A2Z07_13270 [Armatimonadetes bacterium RBG_16_67_12]